MNQFTIDTANLIRSEFRFLTEDFDFVLGKEYASNSGVSHHYSSPTFNIKLVFSIDFRENLLKCHLVRGIESLYPNDHDRGNIINLHHLIPTAVPGTTHESMRPVGYEYAKPLNVIGNALRTSLPTIIKLACP